MHAGCAGGGPTGTHHVEHSPGHRSGLRRAASCAQKSVMGQGDAVQVGLGKPGLAKQLTLPARCSVLTLKQAFHNKKVRN